MKKIITFPLSDKIEYCSVRINNNNLATNIGGRAEDSIEEGFLENLIESLNDEVNYIIDFGDCEGAINTTPNILENLAKKNIMILAEEKLKNAFSKSKSFNGKTNKESEKVFSIIFDTQGELYIYFEKIRGKINDNISFYFHRLVLTRFFYYDIENNSKYSFEKGNLKYLESSNVYVNKYINVKSLFLDANYMILVVKDMKELLKKHFKGELNSIVLLGVSNNGIILANLLAYELNIPVQSLNRLGPVYCLDKKKDKYSQFGNKKYVMVSDVVCMGGEYKMAQGIVDTLGATLLGGVCVVKIRDIYRDKCKNRVFALLDHINEILVDGQSIDYQIYVDDN